MATTLTQQQINDVQALTANVDASYRALGRSRTALSYLINAGQATCNDVKAYNLMVKSTFFYQKSIAEIIRAQGGTPPAIQQPYYVAYKGRSGEDAVNIDCSTALSGWKATGLGDYFIDPKDVEWKVGPTPSDTAAIGQVLGRLSKDQGLGNPLLLVAVPIILWGIVITVTGLIVLKIVEALTDVPGKREYTRQVQVAAERHATTMEARQKCVMDCLAKGGDHTTCARNCSRLYSDFKPPAAAFSLGLIGKIVIGVAAIGGLLLVGTIVYRRVADGGGGMFQPVGNRRALPPGRGDDDDEDEDDDVIDAEYEEK